MVSVRLPDDLKKRLELISAREQKSKSEIIKDALEEYLTNKEQKAQPYALGKDLFGKYGNGSTTDSQDYKKKVRDKIHAKYSN